MRSYNFEPLWRSTIGFDRLFDLAEAAAQHAEDHYPPYNIERLGEDHYQISLALAGFSPDEISVTAEQNVVTVDGDKAEKTDRDFMYQGGDVEDIVFDSGRRPHGTLLFQTRLLCRAPGAGAR